MLEVVDSGTPDPDIPIRMHGLGDTLFFVVKI